MQVPQQVDPDKVHAKLLESEKQDGNGGLHVGPVHQHLELSLGQVDLLNCRLCALQNASIQVQVNELGGHKNLSAPLPEMGLKLQVLFHLGFPEELLHERNKQRLLHPFQHLLNTNFLHSLLLFFAEHSDQRLDFKLHFVVNQLHQRAAFLD